MIKSLAITSQDGEIIECVEVREIAKELGISRQSIVPILRRRGFEPFRIDGNGRINYIFKSDFLAFKKIRYSLVRSRMAPIHD